VTTAGRDEEPATNEISWRAQVADYLSLERNVTIASASVFLLGLGEELWKKFLPKYLEALGASTPVIGLFGAAEIFLTLSTSIPVAGLLIASDDGALFLSLSFSRPRVI